MKNLFDIFANNEQTRSKYRVSSQTVREALLNMRLGVKPTTHYSDKFTSEDIDRMAREAYRNAMKRGAHND